MQSLITLSKAKAQALAERERRRRLKSRVAIFEPGDMVDWIEKEFYIPERQGMQNPAMQLEPYQRAVLREADRRDADGKYLYDLVIWSDIKKSAKSSIAGAVTLYRATHTAYGSFKIVGNDLKQADSRVFGFIVTALNLNPRLKALAYIKNYRIRLRHQTLIEALPIDPKGEAGGNDDMIEFTELHAAESKAAKLMWTEMTLSPLKFGYSQRWVDTYAGHSGESPILEPLYETGVKNGARLTLPGAPDDLEVYANGSMLCLWNTRPRCPWQTAAYYASERQALTVAEFSRIHGNAWVSSVQQFIPMEWWAACKADVLPDLDRYKEVVVALDAAVDNDCFAIIALSRSGNTTVLRYARKWSPPPGGKIIFSNHSNPNDTDYPEGEIRRLCRDYNVIKIVYDPYQLESFCQGLRAEGIALLEGFNQGAPRLISDKMLYDCIRERRVLHRGEPDVYEHLNNANSTAEEKDTLRIIKRAEKLKIDLAVALSMANKTAYEVLPE